MRGLIVRWLLVVCFAGANGLPAQPFFRKDLPFAEPFAVAAGDFNGDHRPDLAVYLAASCSGLGPQREPWYDGLFTLLNTGGGNFGRPIRAGVEFVDWCGLLILAVADVNGDGKDDLATAGGVFLSRGDGTFQSVEQIPYRNTLVAAAGDFNSDRKSDLLINDEAATRVLLSNGDGTFRSGPTLTPDRMIWAATADLNRDGAIDVICSGSAGRLVFLGNGDGTFGAGIQVAGDPYPLWQPGDFFVADFHGDGLPDLATQAGIQLGAGDGTFQSRVPYPWIGLLLYAAGDFTGDGKADLIGGWGATNYVVLYPGKGDGTFSGPLGQTVGWGDRRVDRVTVVDLDGDGRLDLVTANGSSNTVSVLMAKAQAGPTLRRAVSAASGTAIVAPQSLASLFAPTPATATASAAPPWPTRLGGLSLQVRDSAGTTRLAPLLFTSPTQINFQVPADTALGEAALAIVDDRGITEAGSMQVDGVAPALFMVSPGVVAATAVLVEADGTQVPVPLFSCSGTSCQSEALPRSTAGDRPIYLSFYGTGFRRASPGNVICGDLLTGERFPVLYAGPQGTPGLDQINVGPLPVISTMWGALVSIQIDGVPANSAWIGLPW